MSSSVGRFWNAPKLYAKETDWTDYRFVLDKFIGKRIGI